MLNKSGIVQVDSFSILNGQKLEHREISDVLLGPDDTSYGFHQMTDEKGETFYAVYYTSAIVYESETIGLVLFSDDIQDVVEITQDFISVLIIISVVAAVVLMLFSLVFSGYITKPINDLKKIAISISKGNLTQRIKVTARMK